MRSLCSAAPSTVARVEEEHKRRMKFDLATFSTPKHLNRPETPKEKNQSSQEDCEKLAWRSPQPEWTVPEPTETVLSGLVDKQYEKPWSRGSGANHGSGVKAAQRDHKMKVENLLADRRQVWWGLQGSRVKCLMSYKGKGS